MLIGELARLMERDPSKVYESLQPLINAGIVRKIEGERICFPSDAVHIDFVLKAMGD